MEAENRVAPLFLIVTPCLNSESYIDETIASVIGQRGPFRILYHIQDGGSTDGTLRKVEEWRSRLDSGTFPAGCKAIEFSYASCADKGMYDAIAKGFERLSPRGASYMSWLNADDCLMPGALGFLAKVFAELPEISLLGGRPCEIDESGMPMRVHDVQIYSQRALAAGLHDGRLLPFVMQEGTFWRTDLWETAGGVRADFRLASDFELWRRFAAYTQYVSVDAVLAAHRRHADQLTHTHERYYREIDAILAELPPGERDREWKCYQKWRERSDSTRDGSFNGQVLCYLPWAHRWSLETRPSPASPSSTFYVSAGGAACASPARCLSGFSDENGPYSHLNLPAGVRTVEGDVGSLAFEAPRSGPYRLWLRFRTFSQGMRVSVAHGARTLLEAELPLTTHDRDGLLYADAQFIKGQNTVSLRVVPPAGTKTCARLLVISCEATPGADSNIETHS